MNFSNRLILPFALLATIVSLTACIPVDRLFDLRWIKCVQASSRPACGGRDPAPR